MKVDMLKELASVINSYDIDYDCIVIRQITALIDKEIKAIKLENAEDELKSLGL